MKKAKVTVWMLTLVLCGGIFLAGCGRSEEPEEVEVVAETISLDDEEDEMQSVGEPTATLEIQMTNELGDTITGITVRPASESDYPENMMSAGQIIENNETFRFYYDLQEATTTTTTTEEATEDPGYCLQVTTGNNTVYEFSYFYPDDMTEVTLRVEDGVPYLEYMSLKTNTMVSTLEAEKTIKANKDAAQAVIDMISAIGTVSEETIDTVSSQAAEARAAYEALTPEQQAYVTNYALLEQKESEIEALGDGGTMDEDDDENWDDIDGYETGDESGYDDTGDWDDIDGYETGDESGFDDLNGYETGDESGYDDTEDNDYYNSKEGN